MLGFLFLPVAAEVEVLEAQGHLEFWVVYGSSHGPCAGASWSHEVAEGTTFDLQTTSSDESCIESIWSGRCDAGGLLYSGELLPVPESQLGWWLHLDSQISALIQLTTPTRVSAIRTVEGVFSPELHTVILTFPDGTTEVLLGSNSPADSAERFLNAGIYRITFSVASGSQWPAPLSYTGIVEVNWDHPVEQSTMTWGEVKSSYRPLR